MYKQVLFSIWLLFGSIALLSCSPTKDPNTDGNNSTTQTTEGNPQGEQPTATCPAPFEMAADEKKLANLSYKEKFLLGAAGVRDKVIVKMPQSVMRWMAWFKTNLSSLSWTAAALHDDKSAFISHETLSLYSKVASSDAHLPSSSLTTSDYNSATEGYGIVILGGTPAFPFARVTHRVLDYFSDSECTATVSAQGEDRADGGHFTVSFANSNEIKLLPIDSRHSLHFSNIVFWVGQDDNLKLQYVIGKTGQNKDRIKFETYTKCGEKIQQLDQQCIGNSYGIGFEWSCDDA